MGDTSRATRPAAASLLLPHHHMWRGRFPSLRWQISFQHYPHVSRDCLLLTLRAMAVPSVGVTSKPLGWVWLARHPSSPILQLSSSPDSLLTPCLHVSAARLWLPAQPTPARSPKCHFPSSAIPTCTAKPSPSSELGVGGGVYLSFGS